MCSYTCSRAGKSQGQEGNYWSDFRGINISHEGLRRGIAFRGGWKLSALVSHGVFTYYGYEVWLHNAFLWTDRLRV